MFVKLIFVAFALLILKPAQSAEILSRLEVDDSETSVAEPSIEADSNSEDEELTTITILIPTVVTDGETASGIIDDNPSESKEELPFTSKSQMSNENSDDFDLLPMSPMNDLRLNLARTNDSETPGAGNLQFSIFTSNGNGLQIFDSIDRQRRGNNHPDSHLIDPHEPPQMQLVDNTLRLVAIKSSVDDLAMRFFPNLHVVRRSPQDHQ
ncbi:uncharacterized protein LOC107980729 [Nasonia vitripennis]|uniref:Uncharacterized protein n=1 Tax=Nasonia vitripennis TaxID=7425 RepID=A0A7M7IR88_NASVI|nr:uncharacterized protein LOC107980729 [Nasonia vitripennis]